MEVHTYRTIVDVIQKHRGLSKDCLIKLKQDFPTISNDTLYAILALEYQKRMRYNHNKNRTTIERFWELYKQGIKNSESPGIILRISKENDLCPCLVAKLIVQKYFDEHGGEKNVNQYLRDTSSIPDAHLAYETFLCTLYDNIYGPLSETINHSVGQQYEIKLHNEIVKLGLVFRNEEHLRKDGYDKTPDIKLEVPVAIDGFIVNWIESKANFGSDELHKDYMKNQYLSYWNRFGPGLVVYWFGYVKSIVDSSDKRFIIRDHLPTKIIHINPKSLTS